MDVGPAPSIKRINTIEDLRNWKAQREEANVSRVPIKSRIALPPDLKASLIGFDMGEFQYDPWFDAWSQGCCAEMSTRTAANVYNFSYWQYADIIYYIGHNFVTIPPLVWTNCAHKNGVQSLGTINFDEISLEEAQYALSPKPLNPVPGRLYKEEAIKLLINICNDFGFDGYLINCEKYGTDLRAIPECVNGMLELLAALNTQKLKSIWYDSPMSSANGFYDNKLTTEAYKYFKAASYFQSNYDWAYNAGLHFPQQSFKVLQEEDPANALANRKRMFQGLYCATKGNGQTPPYKGRFFSSYAYINSPGPAPQPGDPTPPGCYTGLNVYYPDWVMYDLRESPAGKNTDKLPDRKEFHNNDEAFWNGSKDFINYPNKGSNPVGETQYMGYYLSRRSVITGLPFVTWFNDGEGDFYNIEGVLQSQGPWNNLSDQNILPTYRFNINEMNTKTNSTRIDHGTSETVFTGGCSLYIDFGNSSQFWLNLFDCNFVLNSSQLFSLVIKASSKVIPYVYLWSTSPTPNIASPDNGQKLGNGWMRYNCSISEPPPNTTILRIDLLLLNQDPSQSGFYIGEFSMLDQKAPPPPPRKKAFPANIDVLDFSDIYRPTSHYRVYGLIGTEHNLIGIVYNSFYRIAYDGIWSQNIFNSNLSGFTSYLVQEVNEVGNAEEISNGSLVKPGK